MDRGGFPSKNSTTPGIEIPVENIDPGILLPLTLACRTVFAPVHPADKKDGMAPSSLGNLKPVIPPPGAVRRIPWKVYGGKYKVALRGNLRAPGNRVRFPCPGGHQQGRRPTWRVRYPRMGGYLSLPNDALSPHRALRSRSQ